jgi:hypothetical protein
LPVDTAVFHPPALRFLIAIFAATTPIKPELPRPENSAIKPGVASTSIQEDYFPKRIFKLYNIIVIIL